MLYDDLAAERIALRIFADDGDISEDGADGIGAGAATEPAKPSPQPLQATLARKEDVNAFLEQAKVFDKDVQSRIKRVVEDAFNLPRGHERRIAGALPPETIAPLAESFPLFAPLLEDLQAHLSLVWRTQLATGEPQPLRLPNILIVGEPGWGKTYFIHRLAELLGLPFRSLAMSGMSAGFILSGSDPVWSTSRPGMIHETLAGGEVLNPAILLDEIDKISGDGRYPVDGPLYQLLEPEQARQFRDEFANYPIDASQINWFASANDLERTHAAIRSRFEIYELPRPTPEIARQTARSVYREALRRSAWGRLFDPEPSEDVLDVLAGCSPREAHRLVTKACGRASLEGRATLTVADFGQRPAARRGIGFVQ
jgi:ATP-dependent Lon protease